MIKLIGTILTATGFLALATATLIRNPLTPDANIGAGILSLIGLPSGAVGLLLLTTVVIGSAFDHIAAADHLKS